MMEVRRMKPLPLALWFFLAVLVVLVGMNLLSPQDDSHRRVVLLPTQSPTATPTAGWWTEVATWTPTLPVPTSKPTQAFTATPTPELNMDDGQWTMDNGQWTMDDGQ